MAEPNKSGLASQIEKEITQYLTGVVSIAQDYDYSQHRLMNRVAMFENKVYPTGKFDTQGNYKFWFSIQDSRVWDEVKNIDFDTKNIVIYDERKIGEVPAVIANLALKQWLRNNGQAEEINDAIEQFSGWGNVVWKKIKGGYERKEDLRNLYVINQTAKTLEDSPVIERNELSQTELYEMGTAGGWKYVKETAENCKSDSHQPTIDGQKQITTIPYYEIYERNGEVKLSDLKEYLNETVKEGDDTKFVLAKVICSGTKGSAAGVEVKYINYAQQISKKPFKEAHRGRYKGRWAREGIIEVLFDLQIRANQIGNQIAQGLEWASKTIFTSADKIVAQNVITDLNNGDIIKSNGIKQVEVRMQGLDQLIADWNRIIALANDLANSTEVVQGDDIGAGTPFRLGALLNQNSNKLFDYLREKLAIPLADIFQSWIAPQLVNELKVKEVLRLTGDSDIMDRLIQLIVDDWYLTNMVAIGPHTADTRDALKAEKTDELKQRPQLLMIGLKTVFEGFKAFVSVDITGEALNLDADLQTLGTFAQLEQDPVRRQAIIELMARRKGLDFGSLPKMPPENSSTIQGTPQGPQGNVRPTNGSKVQSKVVKEPVGAGAQ